MRNVFNDYLADISKRFSTGEVGELSYRTYLELLLKKIFPEKSKYLVFHEGKTHDGNKPDFNISKNDLKILFLETKDIGIDLNIEERSSQMARYLRDYQTLVLTDYLEFRFYKNGASYCDPIKVARVQNSKIIPLVSNFDNLVNRLQDFASDSEDITSSLLLAKIMANKARLIRDDVKRFLKNIDDSNSDLNKIFNLIKETLVHDLSITKFADMYAQTLVYGLFAARFYDHSSKNFSRAEARDLISDSNPFLRDFFDHIAGARFDKRLQITVDELCAVFAKTDVDNLMHQYSQTNKRVRKNLGKKDNATKDDAVIHFYEDFLGEYDPQLKKEMGAYYTPYPVVDFIVRGVDFILKNKFQIKNGLADTKKLDHGKGKHRVQILDPATGTGTFISAVILEIYKSVVEAIPSQSWPHYPHYNLLPRLYGFELMMAPYTIAHLRLAIRFKETGFEFNRRLGIYLTNALENTSAQSDLFSNALGLADTIAQESKMALTVKNNTPVMVIVGNPPYSGESSNAFYHEHDVYKVEPTGGKLQEKNSKWINDDYVKFIRLSEQMIAKTGDGVMGMITAHGYIDNPTFRGMRWHLMQTFDEIFIFDLHGNANKKEVAPDGGKDENVFDIKTGVAIIFGVKNNKKAEGALAKIYRADLFGRKDFKLDYLFQHNLKQVNWQLIKPSSPNYEWVQKDEELEKKYQEGFSVDELFEINGVGIVSARDHFVISTDENTLIENANRFVRSTATTANQLCEEVGISNKKGWDALKARDSLRKESDLRSFIRKIAYRPFDHRSIFYHHSLVWRVVEKVNKHFLGGDNLGFIFRRQQLDDNQSFYFVSKNIISDGYIRSDSKGGETIAPLYLYDETGFRRPNFNQEILTQLENFAGKVKPEEIFDYIYAYLYAPSYRQKYQEFLKRDFPHVPYPVDKLMFKKLSKYGTKLRQTHLLESNSLKLKSDFPIIGDNYIEKISYSDNKVWINNKQYFDHVTEPVWSYFIGGYQPAQKWLKDRKNEKLTSEEIQHYSKIIAALEQTLRIEKEIDEVVKPHLS